MEGTMYFPWAYLFQVIDKLVRQLLLQFLQMQAEMFQNCSSMGILPGISLCNIHILAPKHGCMFFLSFCHFMCRKIFFKYVTASIWNAERMNGDHVRGLLSRIESVHVFANSYSCLVYLYTDQRNSLNL